MIHFEWRERVALVTIDRQHRRNAVDAEALHEIAEALGQAGAADARVLVLTGAGGHFCAGADLKSIENEEFATLLRSVLDSLSSVPFATVAAVAGAALGAGTQLATACDLRVATPTARFGIPAARLGLMVDHRTVQRLTALAGHGPTRAMLLAAEEVDGETAVRSGLAQRSGDLEAALLWAADIAALAPLSIAGHKLALERLLPPPPEDPDVADGFRTAWRSADLREGRAAFAERRSPRFEGT